MSVVHMQDRSCFIRFPIISQMFQKWRTFLCTILNCCKIALKKSDFHTAIVVHICNFRYKMRQQEYMKFTANKLLYAETATAIRCTISQDL